MTADEVAQSDTSTALYVLSRKSGEGKDRDAAAGDYYLSNEEQEDLRWICDRYSHVIIVLNCGGPIDLQFIDTLPVDAILHLSQPGMEGGNALGDILCGEVTPGGKMTDSWAVEYSDFPRSKTYHTSDDASEAYEDGIYIGYRYFDSFQVTPRVAFGFGLSYTTFSIQTHAVAVQGNHKNPIVAMEVQVTNTGAKYAGREVVQVYTACPQGVMKKEYQRLCAFAKTPLLQPSESCNLTIEFPITSLTSFSDRDSAYRLDAGSYVIAVGNSSRNTIPAAVLYLPVSKATYHVQPICKLQRTLHEIEPADQPAAQHGNAVTIELDDSLLQETWAVYDQNTPDDEATHLVNTLSEDQIIRLTCGNPVKSQDDSTVIGSSGVNVPGSAGETSDCLSTAPWHLPALVLADGPAGIRLAQKYYVMPDGTMKKPSFMESLECGVFSPPHDTVPGETAYYQYCTAFPIGTMLAQSWDVALMQEVGRAIARELKEFNISVWLAPGMNLHCAPLCGRNFEYFSEDPLLSGLLAAAITNGVQENPSLSTTIKHYACNHRENDRMQSDSIVSQRALRELYLRTFEIAVKESQPKAIMTSYNLVNGKHTANSYDLITNVLRGEWGFKGLVMTDWSTTGEGGSSCMECILSGNDLIMPGSEEDIRLLTDAVQKGTLSIDAIKQCAARVVRLMADSRR